MPLLMPEQTLRELEAALAAAPAGLVQLPEGQHFPEYVLDNLFIRPNFLRRAGDQVRGHKHNFSHKMTVRYGAVRIVAIHPSGLTETIEVDSDNFFNYRLIRPHIVHEITALYDRTFFECEYAHRDPQGRVTQVYTGWDAAHLGHE